MSSRFFPIGGNGNGHRETYNVQPGDLAPIFKSGVLSFTTESDGTKYIRLTEEGLNVIKRVNK